MVSSGVVGRSKNCPNRLVATRTHVRTPTSWPGAPMLTQAARQIGNVRVRQRGTIGGSLAHGEPASELPSLTDGQGSCFIEMTRRPGDFAVVNAAAIVTCRPRRDGG